MGMETPIVVRRATLTPRRYRMGRPRDAPGCARLSAAGSRQQTDLVVDAAHGGLGDGPGPVRAVGEDAVELGAVGHQLERAGAERRDGLDDDLCDVLLEVAVALACVVLLEEGHRSAR